MRRIIAIIVLTLAWALSAGGCSHRGNWGMDLPPMGEAHRRQIASQTLDPEAGGDAPVTGLHGPVAERVMDDWVAGGDEGETEAMATQMAPQ